MTRGRKPLTEVAPLNNPVFDEDKLDERRAALAVMNGAEAAYSAERDLVNQLLGQMQMADAISKFSATVATSKLAFVKENKLYRGLAGKQTGDGRQFQGTWEEFCELLGCSRRKVDEDIQNLRALGEDALDAMSRMGIGYRELRQYRRLPDDSKEALIEAAKTGDKEGLLELAEELIARQHEQTTQLQAALADATADIAAKDDRADKRERTIETLQKQVHQLQDKRERAAPEETAERLQRDAAAAVMQVRADLMAHGKDVDSVRERFAALREHALAIGDQNTGVGNQFDAYMAGLLGDLFTDIRTLRDELGLPDVNDAPPAWMQG